MADAVDDRKNLGIEEMYRSICATDAIPLRYSKSKMEELRQSSLELKATHRRIKKEEKAEKRKRTRLLAKAALLDKNDLLEAFKLKHERELQTEMWAAKRKEKLAAEGGHAGDCLTAASSGTKPGDSPGATADDASPDPPMHAKLVRESTAALDDHDDGKLDEA